MTDMDRIAELEAENARLREALGHIAAEPFPSSDGLTEFGRAERMKWEFVKCRQNARTALAKTGEDG